MSILQGATTATPFVTNIDYNAKGQRTLIQYGNGASTDVRVRPCHLPPDPPDHDPHRPLSRQISRPSRTCKYTYDPAGNITHIQDDAQDTILFQQPDGRAEQRLHL